MTIYSKMAGVCISVSLKGPPSFHPVKKLSLPGSIRATEDRMLSFIACLPNPKLVYGNICKAFPNIPQIYKRLKKIWKGTSLFETNTV
jgi:hypothetical protein